MRAAGPDIGHEIHRVCLVVRYVLTWWTGMSVVNAVRRSAVPVLSNSTTIEPSALRNAVMFTFGSAA